MSSNKVKSLYFAGTQRVSNCAWFALRNLVQRNAVSAKGLRDFADSLMEGVRKNALEAYFHADGDGLYLLDDRGNAIDFDIQVVKAQLAFLGYVWKDLTREECLPFDENTLELAKLQGDAESEVRRFLIRVDTLDDPPAAHYAVLLIGGVKQSSRPVRWLDSLRPQPRMYWTYEEFIKEESSNYSRVKGVYEMVEMVRYFPCMC